MASMEHFDADELAKSKENLFCQRFFQPGVITKGGARAKRDGKEYSGIRPMENRPEQLSNR